MKTWKLIGVAPRPYLPQTTDCVAGWAWEIETDGERKTVLVELSRTAAVSESVADEALRALEDHGRAAVVATLAQESPPARIIIGTTGISLAA
jgi:hypothetical protein